MPKVTFVTFNGKKYVVNAGKGEKVMAVATSYGVPGIDGDCGGALACGTCHVIVAAEWAKKLPQPNDGQEAEMLQFIDDLTPTSRLCCQITLTDALDGLVIEVPRGQH